MKRCKTFLQDESGAVTVDFVVLTAGVVVVAMLIAPAFGPPVSSLAESIGTKVSESEEFLDP